MKQGITALCGHGVGPWGLGEHLRGVPLPVWSVVVKVVKAEAGIWKGNWKLTLQRVGGVGAPAEAAE